MPHVNTELLPNEYRVLTNGTFYRLDYKNSSQWFKHSFHYSEHDVYKELDKIKQKYDIKNQQFFIKSYHVIEEKVNIFVDNPLIPQQTAETNINLTL